MMYLYNILYQIFFKSTIIILILKKIIYLSTLHQGYHRTSTVCCNTVRHTGNLICFFIGNGSFSSNCFRIISSSSRLPYLLPEDALQWCPAEASPDKLNFDVSSDNLCEENHTCQVAPSAHRIYW